MFIISVDFMVFEMSVSDRCCVMTTTDFTEQRNELVTTRNTSFAEGIHS